MTAYGALLCRALLLCSMMIAVISATPIPADPRSLKRQASKKKFEGTVTAMGTVAATGIGLGASALMAAKLPDSTGTGALATATAAGTGLIAYAGVRHAGKNCKEARKLRHEARAGDSHSDLEYGQPRDGPAQYYSQPPSSAGNASRGPSSTVPSRVSTHRGINPSAHASQSDAPTNTHASRGHASSRHTDQSEYTMARSSHPRGNLHTSMVPPNHGPGVNRSGQSSHNPHHPGRHPRAGPTSNSSKTSSTSMPDVVQLTMERSGRRPPHY